jgi:asparagine synthase (glutamine-hydrolysing)
MCGICGFSGKGTVEDLRAMSATLAHRGPDDAGELVDPGARVFLGHRRLSIIDIAGGHQPMASEDGAVQVIFNGEIYNHLELRRELAAAGHRFATDHSDTEVLVHGYEEWGEGLVARLNGMFAFAIYDRANGRLLLARDRFGEKPLFYATLGDTFLFASELSALRRHPGFDATLDRRGLQKFFAHGFLPAPNTVYRHASKLPAGALLTYDLRSRQAKVTRYYRFRVEPDGTMLRRDEREVAAELRHLLCEAVSRRLMSDVPLGVFLSGGIDSSAVLAFAAEAAGPGRIASFSIGFRERSYDESRWARMMAAAAGSVHHEEILGINDAQELMKDVLVRLDEPLGDASILPTFLLSRFARRHVKVALGGDGGDELFAGYDPFVALRPAELYRQAIPPVFHRFFRRLAQGLPVSARNMSLDFKLRRTLAGLSFPPELWNPVWLGPLEPEALSDLFSEPIDPEELYSEALALWRDSEADNLVDRTLEFYTNFYLPDDILTKVDRASMMVSLEVRSPFLDNDVTAFARRLPHQLKMRRGQRKFLLKLALRDVLPSAVVQRPKKGFGIPFAAWLRQLPAELPSTAVPGADGNWVAKRWREHRDGRADHRLFLWCWLALQYHMG